MKLNDVILIGDAIYRIAERTDTPIPEIIDALTGICWDDGGAEKLRHYHSYDEDDSNE